jgi:FixJ family two-component response regulator
VVIAEDNSLLRDGLGLLFASAGHEAVAAVGTAAEIVPAPLARRQDVAVLDVRMRSGSATRGCVQRSG